MTVEHHDTPVLDPDTAIEVASGEMAVFAVRDDGRRVNVAVAPRGTIVIGTDAGTAPTLLGVAIPGSELVDASDRRLSPSLVAPWLELLGATAADGRWPLRRADPDRARLGLAPGECVLNDSEGIVWVKITGGTARMCGRPDAVATTSDGIIPLPGGTWLEAGLRCRVEPISDPPPADAPLEGELLEGVRAFVRLCVLSALDAWEDREQARFSRITSEVERSQAAIRSSVTLLSSAVAPETSSGALDPEMGPALALVRAYGARPGVEVIQRAREMVDAGSDPLTAVATSCDMAVRDVTLSDTWHIEEGVPLLAEVTTRSQQHVIALLRWRHGWHATDPLTGDELDVDATTLCDNVARELHPLLSPERRSVRDLIRLALRGSGFDIAYTASAALVTGVVAFFTPRLIGRLATMLLEHTATAAYVAVFVLLVAMAATTAIWQMIQSLSLLRLRARATAFAAVAMWERLVREPANWHTGFGIGDRRFFGVSVNAASSAISDQAVIAVLNLVSVLGSLAAVSTLGARTLVFIGLLLIAQATISLVLLAKSAEHLRTSLETGAEANGRLVEILGAIPRIRVAGAESRALRWWAQAQSAELRSARLLRMTVMLDGVIRAIWPTLVIIILVLSVWMSAKSLGSFITAQSAAVTATASLATAMAALGSFTLARRTIERALPVLESTPEAAGHGEDPGVVNGGFRLSDVRFSYPGGKTAIDGVTLTVYPGEHLALVGPSGCGKTTLVRLLLGLEAPESGVITCDGYDLTTIDKTAVRRQIGSVLQSSQLLPGTLRDNVAMGRELTTSDVWAALDAAQIGEDVRAMPMGLQTPVTDGGSTLSGGQQQRLLIARALAGSPRVLIFDEATSALDNTSQEAITAVLDDLRITRIVVAHRLTTIRHATRIVVIDGGRVVDTGTFDELLTRPGMFRDLMMRQQIRTDESRAG